MKRSFFNRCALSRVLAGLMWLGSINGFASSLTLCGIADGDPDDYDGPANGSITAGCFFPGGWFEGTVTEGLSPLALTYWLAIRGEFYGSVLDQPFVTGQFYLVGEGDLYPYFTRDFTRDEFGLTGLLETRTPYDVTTGEEFLKVTAVTSNLIADPAATVQTEPIPAGTPLNVGLAYGYENSPRGEFSGLGTLSVSLSFDTGGPDRNLSFQSSIIVIQASTEPFHIVPEASTVFLVGFGIAGLLVARRFRDR